jgi:hypothetical protein
LAATPFIFTVDSSNIAGIYWRHFASFAKERTFYVEMSLAS